MKATLISFTFLLAVSIVEGAIHDQNWITSTETNDKSVIGRPDGHDLPDQKLIGRPDGHDGAGSNLIGQLDGHDEPASKVVEVDDVDEEWDMESSLDNDEPLVRCKRPLCDNALSCSIGPQTDVNGCAICQCLEDPCNEEKCESGYRCVPMKCPRHGPCKKLQARCQKKKCSGPESMCGNYCPLGYQLNDRGCTTCVCRDVQSLHNFTAEGISMDDDDDSSVSDDRDDYDYEDDSLIIEDLNYHLRKEAQNEDHDDDHDGHDNDYGEEEGEMCEGVRCRKNEICKADWRYPGDSENEKTNRICMIKTRCWAVVNEPFLYHDRRNPDRRQSCDSSLTFEPLQCLSFNPNVKDQPKMCWCTSDLGFVIEGTKTPIHAEEQKPICERNSTISATVSMTFQILGDGLGPDDRTSVKVITEEISKITFAPKSSIKMVDVSYPNLPLQKFKDGVVKAIFILNSHPDYDLPYALDLLFNIKDFRLIFDLYKVMLLEKPKVTSYLFSTPTIPPFVEEDDSHLFDNFGPLPNVHVGESGTFLGKTLVILCLTFLTILILIVLSIIAFLTHRNCRRGHIRHHQLQNQMSVAIDPEHLLADPLKNESVVLVTDDVLSKVKDYSVA